MRECDASSVERRFRASFYPLSRKLDSLRQIGAVKIDEFELSFEKDYEPQNKRHLTFFRHETTLRMWFHHFIFMLVEENDAFFQNAYIRKSTHSLKNQILYCSTGDLKRRYAV